MAKNPQIPYGSLITALRLARGLTREELARLAGVRLKTVFRWETGERLVPPRRFSSLCGVMGYSPRKVNEWVENLEALIGAGLDQYDRPSAPELPGKLESAAAEAAASLGQDFAAEMAPILARAMLDATLHRERQRGERLGKRLLAASAPRRKVLLSFSPLYASWPVVEWLCEDSVRAAARDSKVSLQRAELALKAAEACKRPESPRLQGYAWAFVGNAMRVGNDLRKPNFAFSQAWRLWLKAGAMPAIPLAEWRLLDLEASLRRNQRRWSEALSLINRASGQAPREAQGHLLVSRALILGPLGENAAALQALANAEALIDAEAEPRLRATLRFNQAINLLAIGHVQDAAKLLPELQDLIREDDNELDYLRMLWLRSRINTALDRLGDALADLHRVVEAFSEAKLGYDAALASLDLTIVHLKRDELGRVRKLVAEMVWIFDDADFAQEGLAALRLFYEAARREEATVALAQITWLAVQRASILPRSTAT